VDFVMVTVEGGTFTMGATAEQVEDAYEDEQPPHRVTLSRFAIGQMPVTQQLWQAVMGSNPSRFTGDWQRPVEQVSWNQCQAFIEQLNQLTGRTFRLPTEAEWEFAARGGNKSRHYHYAGSNTLGEVAWYDVNSYLIDPASPNYGTHAVGGKRPNELGLYDMSGNVWEWCHDWFDDYPSTSQTNPQGPAEPPLAEWAYRVHRGGAWDFDIADCRVSTRGCSPPEATSHNIGLRLVMEM
ncbi:MAG: formylglycine-generating enzyme family protein, partial [Muribaculaceae bacterium]|nr:formylglycine-generating enzyme family protein [Muribaculaceae bacterium]